MIAIRCSCARWLGGCILAILPLGCSSPQGMLAPSPPQDISVFSADPNAALIDYLRAENSYTDSILSPFSSLEKELIQEIVDGTPDQKASSPFVLGPFEYQSVEQQTLRHPLIYRKRIGTATPILIFDPNVILGAYPQATLGVIRFSPQHTAVAFSVDLKHSGHYSLFLWDIGKERISEVSALDTQNMEWGGDDCTLFFTLRERDRASELRSWNCRKPDENRLLYTEKDRAFGLSLRRSKSGEELLLMSESQVASKLFAISLSNPAPVLRELRPFQTAQKYSAVSHNSGYFLIKPNGSLWFLERHAGARPEALRLPANTRVEDIDVFDSTILVLERRTARPALQLYRPVTKTFVDIALPDSTDTVLRLPTPDPESKVARVAFESLISPRSVAEVDLERGQIKIVAPARYPAPFTDQDFVIEHLLVPAADGASIPMTVAALRTTEGPAPTLLLGYGAYAAIGTETFSAARLSLLRRGFRIAIAHVRGGGLLGQNWYDAGRRMQKKQSFEDFRTCARYLVQHGLADSRQIFAYGKSAGGLLVAAAAGSDTSLFSALILDRPFVDVMAGLTEGASDLSVREYEEWGDPKNPKERAYIESYSPAQQIAAYTYPPMLVISGMRDEVVPYWDVARWFALLRAKDRVRAQPLSASEKLLWVSTSAGHENEVDSYSEARLQARMNAFVLWQLEKAEQELGPPENPSP